MLISLLNKLQKAREGWGLLTISGTPVSTEGTLSHSILSQVFHSYQFKTMVLGPLTRRFLAGWCEFSLNETDFHRPEPLRFRSSKSSRSDGRREAKKTKRIKKTRSTFCGFAGWLRSYETQRRSYCPRLPQFGTPFHNIWFLSQHPSAEWGGWVRWNCWSKTSTHLWKVLILKSFPKLVSLLIRFSMKVLVIYILTQIFHDFSRG